MAKKRSSVYMLRSTGLDTNLGTWVFDGPYQTFFVPPEDASMWATRKVAGAARRRLLHEDGIKTEIVRFVEVPK